MVRGTTRPKIGQPFLGSVPLVPVSQILAGCFLRWRLQDWSCYSNTNSPAQTKPNGQLTGDCLTGLSWFQQNREKPKRAAQRRLLDWSWSQQKRGKPKGSSPETARLVLVPTETGKTKSSSPETARPVLVTQPKKKDNQPLTQHGRGARRA